MHCRAILIVSNYVLWGTSTGHPCDSETDRERQLFFEGLGWYTYFIRSELV
jgi:hypothetical protein